MPASPAAIPIIAVLGSAILTVVAMAAVGAKSKSLEAAPTDAERPPAHRWIP